MENIFDYVNQVGELGFGKITISVLATALVLFIICLILIKLCMRITERAIEKAKIEKGLHKLIKSIVKIILYFITIIIIADCLGVPITSLIAVLSVAGLAVSLAIQGALSNIASGVMLLVTKPFHLNDYVEIAGVDGTVVGIQLFYTKLITADNRVIYLPNSEVMGSKVINYTKEGKRRFEIKIGASYESKVENVKNAIKKTLENNKQLIMDAPEPFIKISDYKDSYIEYTIRAWATNSNYWDAYFGVMENLKEEFDNYNVEMTYNHINVHMMDK